MYCVHGLSIDQCLMMFVDALCGSCMLWKLKIVQHFLKEHEGFDSCFVHEVTILVFGNQCWISSNSDQFLTLRMFRLGMGEC